MKSTTLEKRWKVQADPTHAGKNPYHDSRFITTEDMDLTENVNRKGSIICAMRDLEAIREVAEHIVDVHNATIMEPSKQESTAETRLLETATDIAYIAGGRRYYSGDSRADITQFIEWARAFEALRVVDGQTCEETFNGKEYMTAIEEWTINRLRDVGCAEVNPLVQLIADLAGNLCMARNENDDECKMAMVDGGCAHELIQRANEVLPESLRVKCND